MSVLSQLIRCRVPVNHFAIFDLFYGFLVLCQFIFISMQVFPCIHVKEPQYLTLCQTNVQKYNHSDQSIISWYSSHTLHSMVYTGKVIFVDHSRFILYGRLATFLSCDFYKI